MRLDKIHIRNYRGFEDLTVELNPQFNLVIGDNGAGKTSFLDACVKLLEPFLDELHIKLIIEDPENEINDFYKPIFFHEKEIRTITAYGQPRFQFPIIVKADGVLNGEDLSWLTESRDFRGVTDDSAKSWLRLNYLARKMSEDNRNGNEVNLPLLSYYRTARLWIQGLDTEYFKQVEGIAAGYNNCMVAHTNSKAFISWYKTYEDEIRKFDKEEDKVFLNVFNSTVSSFVKQWTDMAYSFKTDELIGFMTDENGEKQYLSFNQLSDGYRNVIGMVADMTYRCIQLNPHLKENVVKETEGVVLIDELDLHLHPNWQRRIVADLKRVFPKIQFIATSHSPFIIQSLRKEELINLDTNNAKPEEDPYKQSIEDVAEDIMQVEGMPRSNEFNEMIKVAEEYYGLLKQGKNGTKVVNLRERLTELEARYSDDAAYVALLKAERASTNL